MQLELQIKNDIKIRKTKRLSNIRDEINKKFLFLLPWLD